MNNKIYTWVCSICNEQFSSRRKLQEHRKIDHNCQHKFPASTHNKIHWICSFCNKESYTQSSAKTLHEKYCKANPNALKWIGHKVSEETKRKVSETCKKNKLSGGYRKGSGRGKKGTYKGYYCDSSWELAYVIYNLDHNIKFERNEKLFPYEFNGKQHKYKPDFIENGVYIEIKGYFTEQVKAKELAFPYQLKYIDKNTIKPYLEYVEQTYGKDFIMLYEDKTYLPRKRYCKYCNKMIAKENHFSKCEAHYFEQLRLREYKLQEKKRILEKKAKLGLVDSLGRQNSSLIPNSEWEERKNRILNCGVDLTQFGCLSKIEKATGLTQKQVKLTMSRFNIPYKSHS